MIRWLARMAVGNPVGANLAMIALAVSGLLVYRGMPREVFPDFSLDAIEVFTLSPGASPVDVERLVTTPIEDVLDGLDGVKEMRSVSREGVSRIRLTLESGADLDEVLAGARDRVRGGDVELPDGTDDPTVSESKNRFPVIAVFVYGSADEVTLKAIAEEQSRALEALPGVTSVVATGLLEPRIWVEVDPIEMERHGLSLEEIGAAVSGRVAEMPLGSLEVDRREKLLRVGGDVRWAEDLAQLPIRTSPTGAVVTLERVARVSEAARRGASRGRFNGHPCVHLQVNKASGGDTIDIAREVREYVVAHAADVPAGVAIGLNSDLSVYVENRLQTMTHSGLIGAVLVLLALLGFLSPRVALVTALGIPLSFLGGILVAGTLGVTMNMIAMFALIVVLGMIVDDAIVVGENVYRRMEEGEDPETAAVEGTVEVGRAVFATILTSIAAFLPILLLSGTTGLFMRPLPIVVSACLLISLVEAFTVLPSHLAHWTSRRAVKEMQARARTARAAGGEVRRWYSPLLDGYLRLLRLAVKWRYATMAMALGGGAMIGAFGGVRIPFVLFDDFESKLFYVSLRLDPSSSIEETEVVCRQVEEFVNRISEDDVVSAHTLLGVAASDVASFELGAHLGQVWVELREGEGRTRTTAEVIEALRAELVALPPIVASHEISQPQTGPSGRAIEVSLRGPGLDVLREKAEALARDLATYAGARDVRIDLENGKGQVEVMPNARGRQVGLSEADLARQLRTAFEGVEVASVRRGTDDVDIIVKHPEADRSRAGVLGDLRVALPGTQAGGAIRRVPLREVATLKQSVGPASVHHEDRLRSVVVSADVDEVVGNSTRILRSLEAELAGLFDGEPAYSVRVRGQAEEQAESLAGLGAAAIISGLLIYLVLGTLFQSFLQPLVIMFIIPFAGVGMVFGHAIMDRSITLMSLIGLLALAGVVVNDSLILVDFIGQRRRQGVELMQAVMDSGKLRFRPILLTSVTTMLGLMPLTFFATGQARFLQPMAISIFFGLSLATLLILILVPVAYLVLEDVVVMTKRLARRGQQADRVP
ncbi:MAG: multidrug efflux pump subunit AcrB [Paracoccaceae bacterium]|jgi:multidrug efflux pump subunit AcrB